jgi:hypothetical protein
MEGSPGALAFVIEGCPHAFAELTNADVYAIVSSTRVKPQRRIVSEAHHLAGSRPPKPGSRPRGRPRKNSASHDPVHTKSAERLEHERIWQSLPVEEQISIFEALTRPRPALEITATVNSEPDQRTGDDSDDAEPSET